MTKSDLDSIFSHLSKTHTNDSDRQKRTKSPFFITNPSLFSVEINAHCIVYLTLLVCERQLPCESLNIPLFNSQSCEGTFRAARAMSSNFSSGVNFTAQKFITQANKLSMLQEIKGNVKSNYLRFPRHHKQSKTSSTVSFSSKRTDLSKELIQQTIVKAYDRICTLFHPLNLRGLTPVGSFLSLEQTSAKTCNRLAKSKLIDLDDDDNDASCESDSEPTEDMNDGDMDDHANDGLSEEETDDDNNNEVQNVNRSNFKGLRVVDTVDDARVQTYFEVNINNERKFMHKQTACWMLQKNKSCLSADRLSRVRGD